MRDFPPDQSKGESRRTTSSASSVIRPAGGEAGDAVGHERLDVGGGPLHLGGRDEEQGDLVVQEEAAHVHVRRADDREAVVDDDRLGVDHPRPVEQDAPARVVDLAEVAGAGQVGHQLVRVGRDDQPDVDPAAGGQVQGPHERLVGDEVGGHDPDPPPRREGRRDDRLVERVARHVGAAGDDLDRGAVGPLAGGGRRVGRRLLAGGELPVGPEQVAEVVRGRARHDHRQVAPPRRQGRRAHVFLGQVHAAGQRVAVVDDDDLAVVAQVGAAAERPVDHRHEPGDPPPGVEQGREPPPPDPPRADAVEQQAHLDPLGRAPRQALDDRLADHVAAEDVGGDVDRPLGLVDEAEQLPVRLLAVAAQLHAVARRRLRGRRTTAGRARRALRLVAGPSPSRGIHELLAARHPADLPAAEHQVQRHAHVGQQEDRQHPGDRARRRPLLLQQVRQQHQRQHEAEDREELGRDPEGDRLEDLHRGRPGSGPGAAGERTQRNPTCDAPLSVAPLPRAPGR